MTIWKEPIYCEVKNQGAQQWGENIDSNFHNRKRLWVCLRVPVCTWHISGRIQRKLLLLASGMGSSTGGTITLHCIALFTFYQVHVL